MLMVSAIYYSTAIPCLDAAEEQSRLDAIMDACARNNPKLGLTGALVYERGRFLQVLEGPRSTVTTLLARLHSDPRHTDMVLAEMAEIDTRAYADWSMSFINADTAPSEIGRLPDLSVVPAETLRARIDLILKCPVRVHVAA